MKNIRDSYVNFDLQTLIYNTPGYIFGKDKNFKYVFCNTMISNFLGLANPQEIIGKTDYDFGWDKKLVDDFRKIDEEIIKTGQPKLGMEEIIYNNNGEAIHLLVNKLPMFSPSGEVIGIVGTSVDISAKKEAEKLKLKNQRLELENKTQKITIELDAHKKFKKTVDQMIHDIGTPMAALDILISNCVEIPEETRINIREALSRIHGITGNVLNQYKAEKAGIEYGSQYEPAEPVMLSSVLMQLISERRQQRPKIKFTTDFPKTSVFTFIKSQPLELQRTISNIINNSVDAFENNNGNITLRLDVNERLAKIIIEDNGKGMPKEVVDKILNNIEVTEGKAQGHGIGMGQVRDTLKNNNGTLAIDSQVGAGTKITLSFSRITAPNWVADKIELYNDDLVVVLDDDSSIHGAWDQRFKAEFPHIKLKHFTIGADVVKFINDLSVEAKQKIFLLTDFELLKQDLTGLDVIEQTNLKRSILVTSHYANKEIQHLASKSGTKILPKRVASEVSIITRDRLSINSTNKLKIVDLVILDDDKFFGELLVSLLSENKIIDYYSDAYELLNNISYYPQNTKFSLDNQLSNITGLEIAEKLYNLGYTNLYLLSGEVFKANQIPNYLTVIMKTDINAFTKLKNL